MGSGGVAGDPVLQDDDGDADDLHIGWAARAVRWLLIAGCRARGWRATGVVPEPRRFVLLAVPHTSNWDFPNFLGLTHMLGLRARYMGKRSLFRWPMAGFMRQVGGIPVDRGKRSDMVGQMVAQFARRRDFALTIAPEGTRSAASGWKTGFYQIALQAGVPIVCGYIDYPSRTGGIGPVIVPTGDYDRDMAPAFAFYRSKTGRNPEWMTPLPEAPIA